jgi:hypothetical protein
MIGCYYITVYDEKDFIFEKVEDKLFIEDFEYN